MQANQPGELLEYERSLLARPISVPGTVIEDVLVPNRGYLRARPLAQGDVMRLIDLEGKQVPDVVLYDAGNLKNPSSCMNTKLIHQRWKIGEGDVVYSKFCDRMATIIKDTCGDNVFDGGFCNAEVNFVRYGIDGTHSCRANLTAAMARYGFNQYDLEVDSCFVPFMNIQHEPDGSFKIREPKSRPGDYMDLRAEMNLLVTASNCPSERNPCNGWNPTALRVVIYRP